LLNSKVNTLGPQSGAVNFLYMDLEVVQVVELQRLSLALGMVAYHLLRNAHVLACALSKWSYITAGRQY
jgi:hypothetical protein